MCQDSRIEHLKMIQGVITRMSNYGLFLKGWGVTLLAAIFAFVSQAERPELVFLGLFPTLVFWALDAEFLRYERNYRSLYSHVISLKADQIDFNMNPRTSSIETHGFINTLFRPVLLVFWLGQFFFILLAYGAGKTYFT